MAQVAYTTRLTPDIDYHLDYQFRAWQSIPAYAERWPEMENIDREVFHLEWAGITERRLRQLHDWANQGLLTDEQCAATGSC